MMQNHSFSAVENSCFYNVALPVAEVAISRIFELRIESFRTVAAVVRRREKGALAPRRRKSLMALRLSGLQIALAGWIKRSRHPA